MKKRMWIAVFTAAILAMPAYADAVPGQYGQTQGYVQVDPNYVQSLDAVYEYYSVYMRDYLYTSSQDERDGLAKGAVNGTETYVQQGIVGYAENTPTQWNQPVYRFWNKKTSDHFYTVSAAEKEQLEKDLKEGKDDYVYEGIAWYVPISSGTPVYRFFDVVNLNHYYTSDEALRQRLSADYLQGTGNYRYEGIAWNWWT